MKRWGTIIIRITRSLPMEMEKDLNNNNIINDDDNNNDNNKTLL
jgi:hypothetical protein